MDRIVLVYLFIYLFLQSLADTIVIICKYSVKKSNIVTDKKNVQGKKEREKVQRQITTLRLSYIEYWKKRKGARLDKLILCPLKVKHNKEFEIFNKKTCSLNIDHLNVPSLMMLTNLKR